MITISNLIIGAAVTFVVSSAGRALGEFIYNGIKDLYGSEEEEVLNTSRDREEVTK